MARRNQPTRKNPTSGTAGIKDQDEMASFSSSLELSLHKNRTLQQNILSSLQLLGSQMADNRRMASRLTRELHVVSEESNEIEHQAAEDLAAVVFDQDEKEEEEEKPKASQPQPHNPTTILTKGADPYRPWRRHYFTDPSESTPEPNPDTHKRRRLEEEANYAFYHLSPPWSKDEIKILEEIIKEQGRPKGTDNTAPATTINFEKVATEFQKRRRPHKDLPLRKPRTSQECEIQYQRIQSEQQPAMTKAETKKVLDLVQQYQSDHGKDRPIDWNEIANKIGNHQSGWRCLVAYVRAHNSSAVWTPHQDELLFKYLAAMGPQFVLNMQAIAEISLQLVPDKTEKQIGERANLSLLNPKLHRSGWSDREERKLVLAQKVYREIPGRVAGQFPDRSSKSVHDKWKRTLDPAYTKSRQFTKQEDKLLLQVVGTCLKQLKVGGGDDHDDSGGSSTRGNNSRVTNKIPWTELQREHFPDRRPEQICERWTRVLASDKDVLQSIKAKLALKQGGGSGKRSSVAVTGTAAASLDDFDLKVIRKSSSSKRKRT